MSSELTPSTRLRGRWLLVGRLLWLALVIPPLGLFVAALPVYVADFPNDLLPVEQAGLASLDPTGKIYTAYHIAAILIHVLVSLAVGLVIFWRRNDDWMALLAAFMLILTGLSSYSVIDELGVIFPSLRRPIGFIYACGFGAGYIFTYLFPDGRFVPRWTRFVTATVIVVEPGAVLFGDRVSWLWLGGAWLLGWSVIGVWAQIYRYVYVSDVVQRQQTKWFVFWMTLGILGYWFNNYLPALPSNAPRSTQLAYFMLNYPLLDLAWLCFPIGIGIAVLRYRLWDIDLIINRTLVYTTLTAGVIGLYVLIVSALGSLFHVRGPFTVSMLATGMVAVLFEPLRVRLQRGVNRLMYGERDDPYTVLSRLGQRLETALSPQAVLPTIVETLVQALKLPYTAIALRQGDTLVLAAEYSDKKIRRQEDEKSGRQREGATNDKGQEADSERLGPDHPLAPSLESSLDHLVILPLTYQGESVGELRIAPRAPGEKFSPGDRRLLDDLAHQAGVALYAVRLTAELQQSRERLVTTREEERRRLRRDLHDGLGPALAAQTLKLGAARVLYARDPAKADALLAELEHDIEAALADIRRLVYDLRPPALDDLGLIGAIRQSATHHFGAPEMNRNGLQIMVETPVALPPLPAAVEVAAYRIVQEALANVVRHAQAYHCVIRLAIADTLTLEICDDGIGLPADAAGMRHAGVGLASMRERAAELGGACTIEPGSAGGTRVIAHLPLTGSRSAA